MVKRDARWNFVFRDWNFDKFPVSNLDAQVLFFTMANDVCCAILNNATNGGSIFLQTFFQWSKSGLFLFIFVLFT